MTKTGTTKYQSLFRLADLSEVHMRDNADTLQLLKEGARVVLDFGSVGDQEFLIAPTTDFRSNPRTLAMDSCWMRILRTKAIGDVFDLPEAECNVVSTKFLGVLPC